MASITYFKTRVHMNIRRDTNVQGRINEEVELLASAARLRYAYQIPKARSELQVFRSKLLELAFQWDQSKLVKTILTLVRPATRSGRGYGFIPLRMTPHAQPRHPIPSIGPSGVGSKTTTLLPFFRLSR